jgi:hypothetical protein
VLPSFHNVKCRTLVLVTLAILGRGIAAAQEHSVYLPLVFPADVSLPAPGAQPAKTLLAGNIETTACLQVSEKLYPPDRWWADSKANSQSPEHALKDVIWALHHKDRQALLKSLDPNEAQEQKDFDQMARIAFQQFDSLELVGISRAYGFDDLAVFIAKARSQQQIFALPFVFSHEPDGSFGFLFHKSRRMMYQIVHPWFAVTWPPGAGKEENPRYCVADTVKRATHRVSLLSAAGGKVWHPSQLFLTGVSFDAPGGHAVLVAQIKLTIDKMKSAMAANKVDEFVKYLTPAGRASMKQWFASADDAQRSIYKTTIADLRPFYLFDESPLVVVYNRPLRGSYSVMYFTLSATGDWMWTNYSQVTAVDNIFKAGPLYKAAQLNKPFSTFEIK